MLDPAKELTVREALGDRIAAETGSVFIRRPLIDSEQDWIEKLGVQNVDDELEIKCCTVDFLGFADSPTDGCDDDPLTTISYSVHLFHEYKEKRSDDSNSTDDFAAAVLNLRNSFLNKNRTLGSPPLEKVERLPLTQSGFIILDVDPLTGSYGHYVDLIAKAEIL